MEAHKRHASHNAKLISRLLREKEVFAWKLGNLRALNAGLRKMLALLRQARQKSEIVRIGLELSESTPFLGLFQQDQRKTLRVEIPSELN